MRVPSNLIQSQMIHTLQRSLTRISRLQTEIATGKRLLKPSDDPTGTFRMLSYRRSQDANQQFQRNITDGLRWTTTTEGALQSLVDGMMTVKEIAVQGSDDTPDVRPSLGFTIDQVLEEFLDMASTTLGDRYIFSGHDTSTAPFTPSREVTGDSFAAAAAGEEADLIHARIASGTVTIRNEAGTVTYTEGVDYTVDHDTGRVSILAGGSMTEGETYVAEYETTTVSSVEVAVPMTGDMLRRMGDDRQIKVNMLGSEVFTDGVDLFQLAIDLKNALWKNDGEAVRALMDKVDGALDGATQKLGIIGTRAESLESRVSELESTDLFLESLIGGIEGADLPEVLIQLQGEEMGYEAALTAASRLYKLNLMRFI
ncbi:MAG: flagellar hook-associated protein FlgL [Candidatus Eisenbacteria bacterium]